MKKEKVLFLSMMIVEVLLFILCGYSLIQCFVYGNSGEDLGGHILEISFLFIHLIAIGIVFYLSFRAFKLGASIMNNFMLDEDDNKITSKLVLSAVFSVIFLFMAIYSTLNVFGLQMPIIEKASIGLSHDLMNAGYLLFTISLGLFIYPFIHIKEARKAE